MATSRTSSELWDSIDGMPHYPKATPRRAAFAHALGIIGVLGTVGLAVAAFAPRWPAMMASLETWVSEHRPVRSATPKGFEPHLSAPAAPKEDAAVTALGAPSVPAPASDLQPGAPASTAEPPASTVQPSTVASSAPALPPAEQAPAAEVPATASTAAPSVPPPASAPPIADTRPSARSPSRTEPRLTWREIERRKARYEQWLKQEGLEPIH